MFSGVLDHFVTAQRLMQNWPNRCHKRTSSLNKLESEFLATNADVNPLGFIPDLLMRGME
jgi:hypothetical protein